MEIYGLTYTTYLPSIGREVTVHRIFKSEEAREKYIKLIQEDTIDTYKSHEMWCNDIDLSEEEKYREGWNDAMSIFQDNIEYI